MTSAERLQQLLGLHAFPQHIVDQYPHLVDRLVSIWGTPAMDIFLNDLFFDQRGDRQGFADEVMHELFALQSVHGKLFPQHKVDTVWGDDDLVAQNLRSEIVTDIPTLIEAAKAGRLSLISNSLSSGVYIDSPDEAGLTMLWWACRYGHRELILTLLKSRASSAVTDEFGCTGLHWLAAQDLASSIEQLHLHGADLNAVDHDGLTPLMYAARRGKLAAAAMLLQLGALVNAQDQRGMSALHYAAEASMSRLLELLMAYQADPKLLDCQQMTAADLASLKPDAARLKLYLMV